jgi:hypothetical protein
LFGSQGSPATPTPDFDRPPAAYKRGPSRVPFPVLLTKEFKPVMTAKRFAFAIAALLLGFALETRAQTPSVEVRTDRDSAQFSARGEAQAVRVEVYAPSGELVFEADGPGGRSVEWRMRDRKGESVPDGVYLASITVTDPSGKRRTRVEQVTVSREPPRAPEQGVDLSAPSEPLAPTGAGTAGRIAKWTTTTNLGASVIAESAGRVGVGTTAVPNAVLQINGAQPAAVANNGTHATPLLRTTGGKGGDTTATGKKGGTGANIILLAGYGGDAVAGSMNGDGGSITLQPGFGGTGENAGGGKDGKLLLAPFGGNIGVGTLLPESRVTILGTSTGDTLLRVENNTSSHSGVAIFGRSPGGTGVFGYSASGDGVVGVSTSGYAGSFGGKVNIRGDASIPEDALLFGSTTRQMINLFNTTYGIGVQSGTQYFRTNGGFAWFKGGSHSDTQNSPGGGTRLMRLDSSGNLYTAGAINPTSDRNAKADFAAVNQRAILDKLASIPIQSWHYRGEPETVRHIGPVAQDFKTAFDLGEDDKHISTVDADGVALASIQALYQMMKEKERQIEALTRKVEEQQSQLDRVRRALKRRRAARR